ncbi:MAG: minor extracellular serine protease Vpr [Acidobacteriota bacterium]|jgi:subtilisin family serine protease|nr:minor extracellular serine protease Vpr [Acidobacteriota bacterium]
MYGKSFKLRSILILLVFLFATAIVLNRTISVPVSADSGTTSLIVELRGDPAAVYKAKTEKAGGSVSDEQLQAYRDQVRASQDQFLSDLKARGVSFQVDGVDVKGFDGVSMGRVDYRNTLVLNAITLSVPKSAVAVIKSMPQVKHVEPNRMQKLLLEKSVDYINAPAVYGQVQELTADSDNREGFEGQGINVAVLDTGIDWKHEMFGGDPTPPRHGLAPPIAALNTNKKVIYYLPLTGTIDDYGHGTAASSNIAGYLGFAPGADKLPGTADDIRLHGVAPQARLMGYKVCTGTGSCLTAATNLAIEDAVSPRTLSLQPKPVANVINLSLGGAGGPDDSSAVAASNAALLGTTVVASAGNSGPGENTVGSPAAGRHVIAVGANNEPAGGSNTIDYIGGHSQMIANLLDGATPPTADITQNYVYCGFAETPDQVPDSVNGKIALIARGGTVNTPAGLPTSAGTGLFSNKAAFAFAKGAIAVVIYNNIPGELSAATVRASTLPVVGISQENGWYLKSQMLPNANPNPDLKTEPANPPVGTISAGKMRLNKDLLFQPQMADFSSRGPVQGLGQVKPDVTAPGVAILSATVRVGSADQNTGTMFDPTGYIHASGTSFSGPHVAGAVALVKQAHLNYSPDVIRAALMNTSTNLRSASRRIPKADGPDADAVIQQGAGLIDVAAAIGAKAVMGVEGDGIVEPAILASHSFGETPILNNRIVNTQSVTVTIRDTSGEGGTYNLSTANNRFLELDGASATVSPASVEVPANGQVTFTASITIDGDKVRDASSPKQFQWYVMAKRAGSNETLRMPMYLRALPTVPAGAAASETQTFTGNVLLGDTGAQAAEDVTYVNQPFVVSPAALKIDATLNFTTDDGVTDLDLFLYDANGNEVASSTNAGGPESLSANAAGGGTYVYRIVGWMNVAADYTLTSTQSLGGAPPIVQPFASNFTGVDGSRTDFDGNYTLNWQPQGDVLKYEVEESTDGTNYSAIRQVDGNTTSLAFENVPNGKRSYRVRSITPGRIGFFVTIPSNVESITVDRRTKVDITDQVKRWISNVSFVNGIFKLDVNYSNESSAIYYPGMEVNIVGITTSPGGSNNNISVKNAENAANGKSLLTGALFTYSQLLGTDQAFTPAEHTGNGTYEFNDPDAQMFNFDVVVTAYQRGAGGAGAAGGGSGGSTASAPSGSSSTGLSVPTVPKVLRFTVNPLTKTVTTKLL